MVFAVMKKDGAKNAARNKTQPKTLGRYKRAKTQNMPPREELWGDSPSGLAANAPFRSAPKLTFLSEVKRVVWRVLDRDAKRRACISQAPAKVPFEVYNGFLLEFNSKIVYNRKNNIAVIVRAFYEKRAYFDYMFISFILLDSFFGV